MMREIRIFPLSLLAAALLLGCGTSNSSAPAPPPEALTAMPPSPSQSAMTARPGEAMLAAAGAGCQLLVVAPVTSLGAPITVPPNGVACEHGYLQNIYPPTGNVLAVTLTQSAVYGPDCNVTFNVNSNIYVIRAQQNFCALAAGNVTASVVSGNAQILNITRGGFPNNPGEVRVVLK
jgi:hypothetical protein